jgi:hypothetical protein
VNDEDRPVAYTALHKGMPVVSGSGRKFGVLDRVLDDNGEILHGLVVSTAAGVRFVARDCIERMTTTQIRCSLTDQQVKELPPAPAARHKRTRRWFSLQ